MRRCLLTLTHACIPGMLLVLFLALAATAIQARQQPAFLTNPVCNTRLGLVVKRFEAAQPTNATGADLIVTFHRHWQFGANPNHYVHDHLWSLAVYLTNCLRPGTACHFGLTEPDHSSNPNFGFVHVHRPWDLC